MFETYSLVSIVSKLISKLTSQVYCNNLSLTYSSWKIIHVELKALRFEFHKETKKSKIEPTKPNPDQKQKHDQQKQ